MQRKTQEKQPLDVSQETGEKISIWAWDKHAGIGYQLTCTTRESVPQNDQGDGETNVHHCEWQQRWGVCYECWLDKSYPPLHQLHWQKTTIAQKNARDFTEKLEKFGDLMRGITNEHAYIGLHEFLPDTQSSGVQPCVVMKAAAAFGEVKVWDLLFGETCTVIPRSWSCFFTMLNFLCCWSTSWERSWKMQILLPCHSTFLFSKAARRTLALNLRKQVRTYGCDCRLASGRPDGRFPIRIHI